MRVLPLLILIPFVSKIATQSQSHSWHKEISEAICSPSNMCDFFAWMLIIPDNRVILVFVAYVVELFDNCTVGTLRVSFMSVSNLMSSVCH